MPRSDPFLPIAPAQVKVLVLPVGPVQKDRFASFVERLDSEHAVQLRDVTADSRPNRNMFNPLAFPSGVIFYDLISHVPQPSHLALTPFDLYREPRVILALADGAALKTVPFDPANKRHSATGRSVEERNIRALYQELEALRDTYTSVLVHRILIFDYVPSPEGGPAVPIPEGIATIPPPGQSLRTTIKTAMCDISSLLLAEMTTLAKSLEALWYIESPGQTSALQRQGSQGEDGRRNSQFSLGSDRSTSAERSQTRMSMPAYKGGGSGGPQPGRPSTPVRSGLSGPPTTFDDISSTGSHSNLSSPERSGSPSRPDSGDGASRFQDRVSVQGFGPGGLNERWRNKGRNRVTIVVASLYLQAGRWTDALRELVDGATVSRSINDHLWHGKALELIVVCLLLLSWADLEFQIPAVCLPPPEKGAAAAAAAQALEAAALANPTLPRWMRHFQQILPELLERILGLYTRISAENLPPLPLSEVILRFSTILAAAHASDGKLDRRFLDKVVDGKFNSGPLLTTSPRLGIVPSRAQIVSTLFRAFPSSGTELLTTIDRIVILSGIASILGRLGFRRKKAMVVRELVSVLIGGLVEARTRGAAEMGIHPAAGLVTQNGGTHIGNGQTHGAAALDLEESDVESGIDAFLGTLLKTYGVVEFNPPKEAKASEASAASQATASDDVAGDETAGDATGSAVADADSASSETTPPAPSRFDDSDAAAIARIQDQASARVFGMPGIKLNILRACINFAEALPDFEGVLKFSSDLLRTAGSGVAPGPRREDAAPTITKEEQVRLATNISKTSELSQRLGFGDIVAEYWDEFLVRGVKLEPAPPACVPIEHSKSELPGAAATTRTSQDVDPFIHNPFLKASQKAAANPTLVAMEPATFKFTLQNPYDIEVYVDSIRLEAEGVEFESYVESAVIGPYRTQIVRVAGVPKAAGSLHITGAIVQVRGCRERRFPIFPQPWSAEREEKVKSIGIAPFQVDRTSNSPATPQPLATGPPIKAERLSLTVIQPQPMVVVKSTTLPQSSAMILEGERQVFSVTLQNLSATTPVDFLLFSFQDSTQASVQSALSNRDASPAELYEYELILAKKQALRLRHKVSGDNSSDGKNEQTKRFIEPGQAATFDFEILGKPGLTSGTIQVDYARLGIPAAEVTTKFHTRQVSQQLTVTVNASIEVVRMDVLPLHGSIPRPLWERYLKSKDGSQIERLPGKGKTTNSTGSGDFTDEEYCLLLLDLRNAWPSHMLVELSVEDSDLVVSEYILPGNTSRLVVPLKRIYLEDPHASIPSLNPSRQRQFVVSTGKVSPDMERANREAFWYREGILDVLRGTWTTTGGGSSASLAMLAPSQAKRCGSIELRSMRLTSRMIESVKVDEVGIDIAMEPASTEPLPGETSRSQPSASPATILVDDFAQLRVRITNRTAQPIYPTLRLMPALCHRPLNVALDFTRKLAWNGTLQQGLPLLPARETTDVCIGVTALCRGEFEVTASVEETRLWEPPTDDGGDGKTKGGRRGRPRANTEMLLTQSLLGPRERRIWHSRTPCRFVVADEE